MLGVKQLSILTVFHNHEIFIDAYFNSFEKVYGGPPCSLILADNGSTDNSLKRLLDFAKKFPRQVQVVSNKNLGFSKANNQLAALATTDYLCFLNPDIWFSQEFITPCLSVLKKQKGIVSPLVQDGKGRKLPNFSPFYERSHFLLRKLAYRLYPLAKIQPVDWIMGASLFVCRDEFQALGGFDEAYFLFTEDMDLCRRYANHNLRSFILKDVVLHHPRREMGREKFLIIIRNLKRYFKGRPYNSYAAYLHLQAFLGQIPGDFPSLFLKEMRRTVQ
jgi:GT2 family glycosyltransferase